MDLWWTWRLFRSTKVNVWPLRFYMQLVGLVDLVHPSGIGARPLPHAAGRASPRPLRKRGQALEVHQVHQSAINPLAEKDLKLVDLTGYRSTKVHRGPPAPTDRPRRGPPAAGGVYPGALREATKHLFAAAPASAAKLPSSPRPARAQLGRQLVQGRRPVGRPRLLPPDQTFVGPRERPRAGVAAAQWRRAWRSRRSRSSPSSRRPASASPAAARPSLTYRAAVDSSLAGPRSLLRGRRAMRPSLLGPGRWSAKTRAGATPRGGCRRGKEWEARRRPAAALPPCPTGSTGKRSKGRRPHPVWRPLP
jgi:hypothetical protein